MITAYVYLNPEVSKLGNIHGVAISKTGWGEMYCSVNFNCKLHENVKKYADRIEAVCSFTPNQGRREKGIYRSGKITAELDQSIMDKDRDYILRLKGHGYCLEEMESLYKAVRAGNIRPDPRDSYDKEQCKEESQFPLIRTLLEEMRMQSEDQQRSRN